MTPGMQHYGFCEFRDVLDSPYVDYLVPLRAYAMTRWGTPAVPTNAAHSIRQHGNTMLVEYDAIRTFYCGYLGHAPAFQGQVLVGQSASGPHRLLRATASGWGSRGVDFGHGVPGRLGVPWYAEESIVGHLGTGKRIYDAIYQGDGSEVRLRGRRVHEQSGRLCPGHHGRSAAAWRAARSNGLLRTAETWRTADYYLLDDIELPRHWQYKVHVFLNAHYLTAKHRAKVKSVATQPGNTAVWLYAPGSRDGDRLFMAWTHRHLQNWLHGWL